MATFTIRNVPEDVKKAWRIKAAKSGHSLEETLRILLAEQIKDTRHPSSLIDAEEIMRRAKDLESDEPADGRYMYLSQKELSDIISGEFEGL
ncbi:FitA-like ribbon-helix-helix domain-containing protein [Neoaquamicrobium sediminum]|mgnify:CR=1 FL=1|uniref:Antitoxin FitA-like ribbon-helix-helix domain-containing protein n=1 Tax=Neoaquamicrobium sediminum TaxID=1849104 RepID=A0ABV3WP31_9HYPH